MNLNLIPSIFFRSHLPWASLSTPQFLAVQWTKCDNMSSITNRKSPFEMSPEETVVILILSRGPISVGTSWSISSPNRTLLVHSRFSVLRDFLLPQRRQRPGTGNHCNGSSVLFTNSVQLVSGKVKKSLVVVVVAEFSLLKC